MRKIIICLLVCVNAYSQSSLLTDINGYWKLDESSGNAIDATGYNNGTVTGATQGVSGHIGNAYSFNGSSQFITLPDNARIQLTGNLSIGAWVKVISYESSFIAVVGGETGAASLVVRNNGAIQFVIVNVSEADQSTSTISVNNWHYILVTFNTTANTGTYYINGSPAGTFTLTANVTNGSSSNIIGTYTSSSTLRDFNGLIDEVGMWSRVLTTDEASSLYNGISYPFVVETRIEKNTYRNNVLKDRYRKVGSSYVQKNLFRKKGKPQKVVPEPEDNIIWEEDFSRMNLGVFSYDSSVKYWPETNYNNVNVYLGVPVSSIVLDTIDGEISKALKVYSPPGATIGGFEVSVVVPDAREYYLSFHIKYSWNYNSSGGGKMPGFSAKPKGFSPGECPEGSDGFIAKVNFEQAGEWYTYEYSHDKIWCGWANTDWLDTIFMVYGNEYEVVQRVAINTFTGGDANTDGIHEVWADGHKVLEDDEIKYMEVDDPAWGIDGVIICSFHGGTGEYYAPSDDGCYVILDNFKLFTLEDDPTWGTQALHANPFLKTPQPIQNKNLKYDHLITEENTYQSSDYGFVLDGFDETWLIDAGEGNTATVDFTAGGIGNGDRIHILDGNQTDNNFLELKEGPIGDISSLGPYTSSGRYLFVRYSADYDGGYIGVRFTVEIDQSEVLLLGNSTMAPIDDLFIADDEPYVITNIAVSGHTILQQKTAWDALSDSAQQSFEYICLQIGLNDLGAEADGPGHYQILVDQLNTDAPEAIIIAATLTPTAEGEVNHTKWLALNAAISSTITGIDYVMTANTTGLDLDEDEYLDEAFDSGDGVHPNDTGDQIIKDNWVEAIEAN